MCLTCESTLHAEQIPARLKRMLFQPVAVPVGYDCFLAASTGSWLSICLTCEHSFRAEQLPAYVKRRLFQPVAVSADCCASRIYWLIRPAAVSTGSLQMVVARPPQSVVLLLLTCFSLSGLTRWLHRRCCTYNGICPLSDSGKFGAVASWR